jgi:hypothetical protein
MGADIIKELDKAEEKKEKRELGIGGLLIIGVIIWALFPPKPPKNEEPKGEIVPAVTIGDIVAHSSPGEVGGTVRPGQTITLTAGIDNKSTRNSDYVELPVTIKYTLYEGSGIMPTPGTLLLTLTTEAILRPGITTYYDAPSYQETLRPQERRDVRVEVLYKDEVIAERKKEDLYYVREEEFEAAVEVLSISWM